MVLFCALMRYVLREMTKEKGRGPSAESGPANAVLDPEEQLDRPIVLPRTMN